MRIFDLHADIGIDVYLKTQKGQVDILKTKHLDKLKKGNIKTVVAACFFSGEQDWQTMQENILTLKEEIQQNKEAINLILNSDDLDKDDKLNFMISVEGMCGIDQDVSRRIDWLYDNGVRLGSLCWNESNALAEGWPNNPIRGLSTLGKEAIKRMNQRKMIVDVSHTNEKSFWDIITISSSPIVATHSNVRSLCDHQRNLTDQQIKAIALKEGLIGLNAAKSFIDKDPLKQTAYQLALHGKYIADLVGYQHLALGFDFMDFFDEKYDSAMAVDLPNAKTAQTMIKALKDVGFEDDEVAAIAYENAKNFFCKNL